MSDIEKLQIISSKSGDDTLLINDKFIHSKYNPKIEGNNDKSDVSDEDILNRILELEKLGVDKKASIEITCQEFKTNKNYVKNLVIKSKNI